MNNPNLKIVKSKKSVVNEFQQLKHVCKDEYIEPPIWSNRVQSQQERDDVMSSNMTTIWETGPCNRPTPELQSDILSLQAVPESCAVSEPHLVYLRPGVGERTILDVLSVPHCSTTVTIPHPESQPTVERFAAIYK